MLSVDLVTVAGRCGHGARHIAHVGRAGWKRPERRALRPRQLDLILVTNNASDLRQLYATQPLHADLVIRLPHSAAFCSSACSVPHSMNSP
jgi:hypothetical protein